MRNFYSLAAPLRLFAAAAIFTLLATGCGNSSIARDPGSSSGPDTQTSDTAENLDALLELPAQVRTRDLATIIDTGNGPEICLGPIAAVWPPQCSGPRVLKWQWKDNPMHEAENNTRWGSFLVVGTWEGESLTVSGEAIPAALYDPMYTEPAEPAKPQPAVPAEELQAVAVELEQVLPGFQGVYANEHYVIADVIFDNGALQKWADGQYGKHVVHINSYLVPASDS